MWDMGINPLNLKQKKTNVITKLNVVVYGVDGGDWSRLAAGGYPIKKSHNFLAGKINTEHAPIGLKIGYLLKLMLN